MIFNYNTEKRAKDQFLVLSIFILNDKLLLNNK